MLSNSVSDVSPEPDGQDTILEHYDPGPSLLEHRSLDRPSALSAGSFRLKIQVPPRIDIARCVTGALQVLAITFDRDLLSDAQPQIGVRDRSARQRHVLQI